MPSPLCGCGRPLSGELVFLHTLILIRRKACIHRRTPTLHASTQHPTPRNKTEQNRIWFRILDTTRILRIQCRARCLGPSHPDTNARCTAMTIRPNKSVSLSLCVCLSVCLFVATTHLYLIYLLSIGRTISCHGLKNTPRHAALFRSTRPALHDRR